MTEGPVVLFDGVCHLCSGTVRFLLRHDGRGRLRFAPLQSEYGRSALKEAGLEPDSLESFVLLKDGRTFVRSDASLEAARELRAPWRWASTLLWVPRPLRDAVYSLIARHRYRWFGKSESCFLPTAAEKTRFLG